MMADRWLILLEPESDVTNAHGRVLLGQQIQHTQASRVADGLELIRQNGCLRPGQGGRLCDLTAGLIPVPYRQSFENRYALHALP